MWQKLEHGEFAIQNFFTPAIVLLSLVTYGLLLLFSVPQFFSTGILLIGIAVGSWQLVIDTFRSLLKKSFALDYIAILAILVGTVTQNYFVAGVIVLMMSGGNALEGYAQQRAKKSLTALKNRIPNQAQVVNDKGEILTRPIEKIAIGSLILVRKGEVVPLDGKLEKGTGVFDESSLTGEPYPVIKYTGDIVRSGTINSGEVAKIKTTALSIDSTYNQIVELVKEAEKAQAPFIQLADKLSLEFTLLTLLLGAIAYFISGDLTRVLAVLVIATPCPLILATPIALIGGMNAAAQQRIILKRLASLEILSRTKIIVFDKTGTITIGEPLIESIEILNKKINRHQILALASGLERNSLHPYAKVIVSEAQKNQIQPIVFDQIQEKIGLGIQGNFEGQIFQLSADQNHPDSQVVLTQNETPIGIFTFKDDLKESSVETIKTILAMGLRVFVFTGDTLARTQQLLSKMPTGVQLEAQLSPTDKTNKLSALKKHGDSVAMVGDGINDAPALATADIGIAFSRQEHTAASEAADVVLIGRNFSGVLDILQISRRTMFIAKQSMYVGLGLSLIGMILATGGLLTPVLGAVCQEIIDVAVIFNALRTTQVKSPQKT